jgi:hypothetical protein
LARKGGSIAFEIQEGEFRWAGISDLDADRILEPRDSEDDHGARQDAKELLLEVLALGAKKVTEIDQEARQAKIARRTLARAKKELNIRSRRHTDEDTAYWTWELPQ